MKKITEGGRGKGKKMKENKEKCPLAKISLIISRLDFNGVVPAHIRGDFDWYLKLDWKRFYNSFQMWVNSSPFEIMNHILIAVPNVDVLIKQPKAKWAGL